MSTQSNKDFVLSTLKQLGDNVSLPELMKALGEHYTERTVRRWLMDYVAKGLVEKTGQKRGTRYRALTSGEESPVTLEVTTEHYAFSAQSKKLIQQIQQPLTKRNPVSYNANWFNRYQPNVTSYLPKSLQQQLYQAGKRDSDQQPSGTYARRIYNRLLIDLSYNSSRLEGNTYSLLDTKRLIQEGTSAAGKLDEEKIMILNHKDAISHLVDSTDKLIINEQEICTLHYLLADGLVPNQYAGKVRDYGVRITRSTYIPLENKTRLQKQLQAICQQAAQIDNPYEQSFFLLVHIAYLQAFCDVNKRTSRLAANIPLLLHNVVPLSFNDIDKDDYLSALIALYELNETQPLLELYQYSYLRTCLLYSATAEAVGYDEIRVRYRQQRRDLIRDIILQNLHGDAMQRFIQQHAKARIPPTDLTDFIDDVTEDLTELGPSRIAGLGITQQQLDDWLKNSA